MIMLLGIPQPVKRVGRFLSLIMMNLLVIATVAPLNGTCSMKNIIAMIAIVTMLAIASAMAPAERDSQWELYCDMLSKWNEDAAAGIPPHRRGGWPPYRGQCN